MSERNDLQLILTSRQVKLWYLRSVKAWQVRLVNMPYLISYVSSFKWKCHFTNSTMLMRLLKAASSTYLAHAGRDVHKEGMLLSNENPCYPKRVKHKNGENTITWTVFTIIKVINEM